MGTSERVMFSVIIATRNRSLLFGKALSSVLEQRCRDFEVVIVNDLSSEEHQLRYRAAAEAATGRVRLLSLGHTERGHGPSG